MTETMLTGLLGRLSIGYCAFEVVKDDKDMPSDLRFVEANAAFESMTGLSLDVLTGMSLRTHIGQTGQVDFNWMPLIDEALSASGSDGLSQHVEIRDRQYKLTCFCPEQNTLAVALQDLTEELANERIVQRQKEALETVFAELEVIFNSAQDAMFLALYDGEKFTYIRNNRRHQELTGYNSPEIYGKTPRELLGEETGAIVENSYRRCIELGKTLTFEETLTMRGGTKDWLTSLTPVQAGEDLRYVVGCRTDISEVKKLRREKEDQLRDLQAMFSEHTATMLHIDPETGRIIDANPAACNFYGYSRGELLELSIQDINMLTEEEVHRRRLMAYSGRERYFLFPHRLKSGEIRLVDVYSCPVNYGGRSVLFSIIFDVTDREDFREAMNRERELLSVTLHSIGDGVVTTDSAGLITSLNKAAEEITGWIEEEAIGQHFSDIIRLRSEETGKQVDNPIELVLKSGLIVGLANHTVLIRKDGRVLPIDDSAAPIQNETGKFFGVVMVFRDVSRDKEQQRQILYLSYHDPLTGLHNRRYLEEQLRTLDARQSLPLAVVMGDVNGLKITNDVFGHGSGDMLLKKVAETLRENCRKTDILARWGGDEFLLLMPRVGPKDAERFVERVKLGLSEKSEGNLHLSVSFGCAVKTKPEEDLQEILKEAEEWMYHQKLMEGSSYRNTILSTLLATLHENSIETEEHAERIKTYCQAIGNALQLNSEEQSELALLAVLHDIGKVGVRQNVLQKPSPLTLEEWDEMKRHSEIGYRIAQNTPELSVVADYILSHHERWDGKGYPRNLKGAQIPLLCRILAVADAYDAMTSDRVYRKALSKEEAIEELRKNSGSQFDPSLADLFLGLLTEKKIV
ncbi:hypothetical protein SDC9_60137 [bioreactor metagenome]|uniref:Uncharacterized protein n=1 Tax=bioreactor metagenome TaxID=1076179 RepID=A0A644XDD2_9ZZZZ